MKKFSNPIYIFLCCGFVNLCSFTGNADWTCCGKSCCEVLDDVVRTGAVVARTGAVVAGMVGDIKGDEKLSNAARKALDIVEHTEDVQAMIQEVGSDINKLNDLVVEEGFDVALRHIETQFRKFLGPLTESYFIKDKDAGTFNLYLSRQDELPVLTMRDPSVFARDAIRLFSTEDRDTYSVDQDRLQGLLKENAFYPEKEWKYFGKIVNNVAPLGVSMFDDTDPHILRIFFNKENLENPENAFLTIRFLHLLEGNGDGAGVASTSGTAV